MIEPLITEAEAERRRLSRLSIESEDHDVIQVEMLYRNKWRRFEISSLEVQHLSPQVLWDRYMTPTFQQIGAPDPVLPDPDTSQVGVADIGGVD